MEVFLTPADDLQAAFDALEEKAVVHLAPGEYRQKTVLRRAGVTLLGAGADQTVLIFDDHARKLDNIGREYNTFRTYTMAICADAVTIRDLSIVNDGAQPRQKGQEVALSVVGTDFLMENCTLCSTQDTLFLGPLPSDLIGRYEGFLPDELRRGIWMRQHFRNCRIEGTVDFIFGCGAARFDGCTIHSLVDERDIGFVAAPAHEKVQQEGFRFVDCRMTMQEGVTVGSVYLARPWRDHGIVCFENCRYDAHIAAEGFDKWNDTHRDRTARFYESPLLPGRVPWVRAGTE